MFTAVPVKIGWLCSAYAMYAKFKMFWCNKTEIYQFSDNTAIWEMTSPYYHISVNLLSQLFGAESQQSTGHTTARQRK